MVLVVNIIGQRYEMVGLLFEADCMSLVPQAYSSLGKKKKKTSGARVPLHLHFQCSEVLLDVKLPLCNM